MQKLCKNIFLLKEHIHDLASSKRVRERKEKKKLYFIIFCKTRERAERQRQSKAVFSFVKKVSQSYKLLFRCENNYLNSFDDDDDATVTQFLLIFGRI